MAKASRAKATCSILAVNNNILEKSGSWFSYKGERIGQGRENARQFLKDNKDMMARLETEVRKALGLICRCIRCRQGRNGSCGNARVATMPAPPEPIKGPVGRKRSRSCFRRLIPHGSGLALAGAAGPSLCCDARTISRDCHCSLPPE